MKTIEKPDQSTITTKNTQITIEFISN